NPKFGCGLAQCGACTVHVDGQPARSCVTPVSAVQGKKVTTIAGLGTPERPHPLQQAFVAEQVPQCGYCLSGWMMTAAGLLRDELDSWIAILPDGNVTAFFGKMDMGQGVDVAIGQIVAEELDVRFERVNVVMGDTAFTCNQGGASGSTGIQNGALTLRYAAAEARRLLLERAVEKLGAPAEKLAVKEGVVSVIGESQRTTTYGELIGGQHFHHKLEWNKRYGNPLLAKGQATPKKAAEY